MMRVDTGREMRVLAWLEGRGLVVDVTPMDEETQEFRHRMNQHWGRWWNAFPWEEELWAKLKREDRERDRVAQYGWQG
jgi:hypothetical protein